MVAGFALACVGGPLALVALYGPDAVGGPAIGSAGLVALLGAAGFLPILLLWWRYSQRIASDGGLYEFVRQSAGTGAARTHGVIWIVSYLAYLPFTVTALVYDVLPVGVPGIVPYRAWIQVATALAIVALVVAADRTAIVLVAIAGVAQVAVLIAFAAVMIHGATLPLSTLAVNRSGTQIPRGAANVALLFVCVSLPLYLGGEAAGGGRTIRRSVVGATLLTAVLLVGGMAGYAALAEAGVANLPVPGYTVALIYGNHAFAEVVLLAAAGSVACLILAEYLALTRVLHAMTGLSIRRGAMIVGALFLLGDVVTLVNPKAIYDHALTVSLITLYTSQLIVVAVYPAWRRRTDRVRAIDLALTAGAGALMIFGLYVAISQSSLS